MKLMNRIVLFTVALFVTLTLLIQEANAARSGFGSSTTGGGASKFFSGGENSLSIGGSTVSANQNDLNRIIDTAHTSSSADTKNLGTAFEVFVNWAHRIDLSSYTFLMRASYFTQNEKGSGTGGDFNYSLSGYSLFPIFRFYALENSFIHFFLQTGIGYGNLTGDITAGSNTLTFNGNSIGGLGGIGVDFCFSHSHCLTIEWNLRYLPFERNVTSGGNCSGGSAIPGISQCGGSSEVESDNSDLRTTMSGVLGMVGYTYNF